MKNERTITLYSLQCDHCEKKFEYYESVFLFREEEYMFAKAEENGWCGLPAGSSPLQLADQHFCCASCRNEYLAQKGND